MLEAGPGCHSLVMLGLYETCDAVLFEVVCEVWHVELVELAVETGPGSLFEFVFEGGLDLRTEMLMELEFQSGVVLWFVAEISYMAVVETEAVSGACAGL